MKYPRIVQTFSISCLVLLCIFLSTHTPTVSIDSATYTCDKIVLHKNAPGSMQQVKLVYQRLHYLKAFHFSIAPKSVKVTHLRGDTVHHGLLTVNKTTPTKASHTHHHLPYGSRHPLWSWGKSLLPVSCWRSWRGSSWNWAPRIHHIHTPPLSSSLCTKIEGGREGGRVEL